MVFYQSAGFPEWASDSSVAGGVSEHQSRKLEQQFAAQRFANEYALADGVALHDEHGEQFQIPPPVMKKHVRAGQFVELRVDSPRFSRHQEDAARCPCPNCHGPAGKPILRHEQPESLVPLPRPAIPSRGWGEDFWVRVTERDGGWYRGIVDNRLYEARLHELDRGGTIVFHEDHILAIHPLHRRELVLDMDAADLKALAQWLGAQRDGS